MSYLAQTARGNATGKAGYNNTKCGLFTNNHCAEVSTPITGRRGGGHVSSSHQSNEQTPRGVSDFKAIVSPITFDLNEVPCWNNNSSSESFFNSGSNNNYSSQQHGNGSNSLLSHGGDHQNASNRNYVSQSRGGDGNRPSFLPGLLNSGRLENKLLPKDITTSRPKPSGGMLPSNGRGGGASAVGNGHGHGHSSTSGSSTGRKQLFQTDRKTYQVAGGAGGTSTVGSATSRYHPHEELQQRGPGQLQGFMMPRNISTAAPALASAAVRLSHNGGGASGRRDNSSSSSSSSIGSSQSSSFTARQQHNGTAEGGGGDAGLPVEPWAYRIIEQYNNPNQYSRPVSRTSTRISQDELVKIKASLHHTNNQGGVLRGVPADSNVATHGGRLGTASRNGNGHVSNNGSRSSRADAVMSGDEDAVREEILRAKSMGRFDAWR